ncbi:hypothetical protein ACGU0V_000855 [Serratia marcescens]
MGTYDAYRNIARIAADKQHPTTPLDTLSCPIIMKHFAQVELLGISLPRFNYTIGMLNGRFTER